MCINIFGTSIGQFMHKLSHIISFEKGHLEIIPSSSRDTHTHYPSSFQENSPHSSALNDAHEHNQVVDFMLTAFNVKDGNTTLPDVTFISLFTLIIDGIINNIILPNAQRIHQDPENKPVVDVFPFQSTFLQIPTPPPRLLA